MMCEIEVRAQCQYVLGHRDELPVPRWQILAGSPESSCRAGGQGEAGGGYQLSAERRGLGGRYERLEDIDRYLGNARYVSRVAETPLRASICLTTSLLLLR